MRECAAPPSCANVPQRDVFGAIGTGLSNARVVCQVAG